MRLLVTLLVPFLIYVVGRWVALPGLELTPGMHVYTAGIFAVPLASYLAAFGFVEVACVVVPGWRPLRLTLEGRARLSKVSGILGLVAVAFACFGHAQRASTLLVTPGLVGTGLVFVTLFGGVALQLLAARLLDAKGLLHGLVVMSAASMVQLLAEDGFWRGQTFHELAAALLGTLGVVVATAWLVRDASALHARATADGSPYRGGTSKPLDVPVPLPVSSFEPLLVAQAVIGLVLLALSLAHVQVEVKSPFAWAALSAALTGGCVVLLTRWLHREGDTRTLRGRLPGLSDAEYTPLLDRAVRAGRAPTLVYFGVVILAGLVAGPAPTVVAMLVPVVLDLVHAARLPKDWVVVGADARVDAIPLLRAALMAEGIASEARGARFAAFWQLFAPYAPTQILVLAAHRDRAAAVLEHLLGSTPAAPRAASADPVVPLPVRPAPAKRLLVLAFCALLPVLGWVVGREPAAVVDRTVPRAEIELVRVDDESDPFADVDAAALPASIELAPENVPLVRGTAERRYATIAITAPGGAAAAKKTLEAWLTATVRLPAGRRFGFELVYDYTNDDRSGAKAVRTLVLTGDSAIHTADVETATVPPPDVEDQTYYVAITLTEAAAKRFEDLTRDWVKRRIAIVVDGMIDSAPRVQTPIAGGRLTLTMGSGSPETQKAEAHRMASALSPRD